MLEAFAVARGREYVERSRELFEVQLEYAGSLFEFLLTDGEAREWLAEGRWLPEVLETLTYRPTDVYVDSHEEGKRLAREAARSVPPRDVWGGT